MKWIGRIFLILFLLLAGFLAVSAGLAYVAGQYWREAVMMERIRQLDTHFEAIVIDRAERSAFGDEDCHWISEAHYFSKNYYLSSTASRIELILGERGACGVELMGGDELRRRRVINEERRWNNTNESLPAAYWQDIAYFGDALLSGHVIGTFRYRSAQVRAGLIFGNWEPPPLSEKFHQLIDGFLDGSLSAREVRAELYRARRQDNSAWSEIALEYASYPSAHVQDLVMHDLRKLYWARIPQAIWALSMSWHARTNGESLREQPLWLAKEETGIWDHETDAAYLRHAIAHGHAEATRAFLENGWDGQGEDGNGDGIVWNDPFSTPYWWAVHAIRLGDLAFADDLDAAMAHLEAQGCADHARAVGEAWRDVLENFWDDRTAMRNLILERLDCIGPGPVGDADNTSLRRYYYDDPLERLPELFMARELCGFDVRAVSVHDEAPWLC